MEKKVNLVLNCCIAYKDLLNMWLVFWVNYIIDLFQDRLQKKFINRSAVVKSINAGVRWQKFVFPVLVT